MLNRFSALFPLRTEDDGGRKVVHKYTASFWGAQRGLMSRSGGEKAVLWCPPHQPPPETLEENLPTQKDTPGLQSKIGRIQLCKKEKNCIERLCSFAASFSTLGYTANGTFLWQINSERRQGLIKSLG